MVLMLLWSVGAAWRTVFRWLRTPIHRMAAHAVRNEDLSAEHRDMLRAESAALETKAARLRTAGRALEDAEDDTVGRARDETVVTDALCDAAQGEAWHVLDMRKPVLVQAGTTRESVLGAPLGSIKKVGRERTVDYALGTARNLRHLPAFPERDPLADKLDRRAEAHRETAVALGGAENSVETDHRALLEASANQLRVEMVQLHGRLTARFPREFVEDLFPRSRPRPAPEEPPPADPTPP